MSEAPQHHTLRLEPPGPSTPPGDRMPRALLLSVLVVLLTLGAVDAEVLVRRNRYRAEIERLRSSMTGLERRRADQIVSQERNKLRLAIALLRRQAKLEKGLHLSVSVDSAAMYLEREGALLREMPVVIGPERRVGVAPDTVRMVPPLGVRRVARVLTEADAWHVPDWVWADRGMKPPGSSDLAGALGPAAVLLDGGAIIYTLPSSGPLADSTYVLPGAVRARAEDLKAVLPNIVPGMRIYFY